MAEPRSIHEFSSIEPELESSSSLFLLDVETNDPDYTSGYKTGNATIAKIGEKIIHDTEYPLLIDTVDKSVAGGINENKAVIGYNYDEYDDATTYAADDLCIYENTLYKALQATTGNLPTNPTYWAATSIADELAEKADASTTYTKSEVDLALSGKQDTLTDSTTTLTPATGVTLSAVNCARYGKVVNLICGVNVDSPSAWKVLTTLPTGYRPPQQTYGVMCKSSSASGKLTAHINVEPNGNVRLANDLPDAGGTYNFSLSWIIG